MRAFDLGYGALALLLIGIVIALRWREVRRGRRIGMSDAAPVCASCDYALGGWSEPICPECGTDARTCGVKTRTGTRRLIRNVLLVPAILIGMPALLYVVSIQLLPIELREVRVDAMVARESPWRGSLVIRESRPRWRSMPTREYLFRAESVDNPISPHWRNVWTDDPTGLAFELAVESSIFSCLRRVNRDVELADHFEPARSAARRYVDVIEAFASLPSPIDRDAVAGTISDHGLVVVPETLGEDVYQVPSESLLTFAVWGVLVVVMFGACILIARRVGTAGTRPLRDDEWRGAPADRA